MPGQKDQQVQQQQSVSAPWEPAQFMLKDLLRRYGGMNTDVTAGQKSALDNLTAATSLIPNFTDSSSDAVRKMFDSTTAPQVGMLSDAYNQFKGNLSPVASGQQLDPWSTPGFSDAIGRMTKDITNNTKAVYAASGRDPSGAGSFGGNLAQKLGEGIAPVIANQYNTNAARMDAANNALLTGAGSTAGGITQQNQVPVSNWMGAIGMLPQIMQSSLMPAISKYTAANASFDQPWTNLGKLLQPVAGIAGLGGQTNSTGTVTQPQSTMSNILGGVTSGIGLLSLLSDERTKEDIEPIGMLNDGQTVVRFRYKGDAPMRIGLLAQDVAEFEPDAVANLGGVLVVDHAKATDHAAELGRAA